MDPIDVLISRGYPPDIAKKMVESGNYQKMVEPFPSLTPFLKTPSVTGADVGINLETPTVDLSAPISTTDTQRRRKPRSLEEVQQMYEAGELTREEANRYEVEMANAEVGDQGDVSNLFNIAGTAGTGVSLEQAAYSLGQSLGAEPGTAKTLGIIGGAGKLAFGATRGILSGLGQAKRGQYVEDYYDQKRAEGIRGSYTPAPQSGNVNYSGGQPYAEEGGIKGKTLPLKDFLKSGGFRKPGFKKLM